MGLGQILKAGLSLHLQCPAKALSNELISNAAYSSQPVAGMCCINHPQPFVADAPLKPLVWKQSLQLRDAFGVFNKHAFTLIPLLWIQ